MTTENLKEGNDMSAGDLLSAILNKDKEAASEIFDNMMSAKIAGNMDTKYQEVAQTMFKEPTTNESVHRYVLKKVSAKKA